MTDCPDCAPYDEVLCTKHEAELMARYPQGWASYPGDICMHGKYVGGCGIDHMCGYCEGDLTHWHDDPEYRVYGKFANGGPFEMPLIAPFRLTKEHSRLLAWKAIGEVMTNTFAQLERETAGMFEVYCLQISSGYWSDEPQSTSPTGGHSGQELHRPVPGSDTPDFSRCPYCSSDELEGSSIDIDEHAATQDVQCLNCFKSWDETYLPSHRTLY